MSVSHKKFAQCQPQGSMTLPYSHKIPVLCKVAVGRVWFVAVEVFEHAQPGVLLLVLVELLLPDLEDAAVVVAVVEVAGEQHPVGNWAGRQHEDRGFEVVSVCRIRSLNLCVLVQEPERH